jgi:hypothetical protein
MSDVTKSKRGRKPKLVHEENAWFESDGTINIEETQAVRRENGYKRYIPPNPPPKKVGKVDPKTICRRAVGELIDSGSDKSGMVMAYYIDRASRAKGACFPSRATTARDLGLSEDAVTRANSFWSMFGSWVDGEWMPYLKLVREGAKRADGTKQSNAYHVGWLPLIVLVFERHWCEELRAEAAKVLRNVLKPERKSAAS